ncbi:MAG: polysaccharide lyase [Bacteroidetes bacterium]|nr:polysaccharide lyase [Bacteroidota bacterium]
MKRATQLIICFTFFALILSCGKVPSPAPNAEVQSMVFDFENASIDGFHYLVPDTTFNTVLVTNPVRKGKYALKNTLRPDDFINNGYRAEFAIYDCAKYKTEVYYGFSFLIDSNYSDMHYNLLCQWQDLPNYEQGEWWTPSPVLRGSSPPMALVYADGNLDLKMNENPSSNDHTFTVASFANAKKGLWYDVVFHVYWSDEEDAFVEAWINGNYLTPFNGSDYKFYKRNLFNRSGNYFKFGQYRGKEKTEHSNIVFFDEIKIGKSFSEVAP